MGIDVPVSIGMLRKVGFGKPAGAVITKAVRSLLSIAAGTPFFSGNIAVVLILGKAVVIIQLHAEKVRSAAIGIAWVDPGQPATDIVFVV